MLNTEGFRCNYGGKVLDFTKVFDNMPMGVLAVRRNLEKNNGYDEVYFNNVLKNNKQLFGESDKGLLFILFEDKYDEVKKVIADIFAGTKKTEVLSSYDESLGGYFSAEFYLAGDENYCICVFREEMELVSSRNVLHGIKNIFYVLSLCDMEEDNIYIFEQRRGNEHNTCKRLNYTKYVSGIIEKIVSKENLDEIIKFMDKNNIRNILTEEKRIVSFEYKRYINSEQKFLWSRMSFIWLNADEKGRVKECVMAVKDIHEEKIKEIMENKSLKSAYDISKVANEAKNAFLRNMGHHMKTPVNYIDGITELLYNSKDYNEKNEKYITKIKNASNEIMEDIKKILDVSRIEAGDIRLLFEKISLRDLIKEIVDEIYEEVHARGHNLYIDLDKMVHNYVFIDRLRLKQVIKNILVNAVKYTDKNGSISIKVIEGKQKFGEFHIYRIIIEDNGPGIKDEIIDNALKSIVLESNDKSMENGIGLGLWISKSIIRILNGDLKIESKIGYGTKCTISVPVSTDKNYFKNENDILEEDVLSEVIQKSKKDIKRILIVQNMITSKNALRQKLTCLGFVVESALTGEEALCMYKSNDIGYYSAIVTDAQLPEISGYDLALEIRKKEKENGTYLPIIAMSNSEGFEDYIYSKGMGITLHIGKTADISVLKAAFDKINI